MHALTRCRYTLGGVTVHVGTAHAGHIMCHAKQRSRGELWLELNDTMVRAAALADLPQVWFGGTRTTFDGRTVMNQRNAIMLFYDRVSGAPAIPPDVPPPTPIKKRLPSDGEGRYDAEEDGAGEWDDARARSSDDDV